MNIIERARALRPIIESLAQDHLEDAEAVEVTELFPLWDGNSHSYTVGERVRYNEVLYKVLQDHTSQPNWTPDIAAALFAKILIPDPGVIPVWEQPDSTNPYMIGDRVLYPDENGSIYESLIDNNVWSPEAYPAGWHIIVLE